MDRLQEILEQLMWISENPGRQMKNYKQSGRQVAGCFPVYTPEVLVHACGVVPMGLWGAQTDIFYAKKYLPPFACPVMQENLEMGLRGSLDGLSAVLIPTLCDTFRCVSQNWKYGVASIPMIPVYYPQNRKIEAAEDFLAEEFRTVLKKLEECTGLRLTEESLDASIKVYNAHTAEMRKFVSLAEEHLDVITPGIRHGVMKSALFTEKAEHTGLIRALNGELEKRPVFESRAKRILLSGILAEPEELLKILEENHLAVAADDLAQESRQYAEFIPEDGKKDGLHRLAAQWINRRGCSLIHEERKNRGRFLAERCREAEIQGVIFCQMKFCDPEEYDYPVCRRALLEAEIPSLLIEIDRQSAGSSQLRTRIQAFAEIL